MLIGPCFKAALHHLILLRHKQSPVTLGTVLDLNCRYPPQNELQTVALTVPVMSTTLVMLLLFCVCLDIHGPCCLQVASYEEDADGVKLHFDGGQPPVQAKVLIGADGYFSRIRKQCLNDGPPLFAVKPLQRCSTCQALNRFAKSQLYTPAQHASSAVLCEHVITRLIAMNRTTQPSSLLSMLQSIYKNTSTSVTMKRVLFQLQERRVTVAPFLLSD